MINAEYFREIKNSAESDLFKKVVGLTEDQEQKQRHIEYAMRFLVHSFVPYDGKLDVEEYIDEGMIALAQENRVERDIFVLNKTFEMLGDTFEHDALRRYDGDKPTGRVGLVALEVIAVGVSQNLRSILALDDYRPFLVERVHRFWAERDQLDFTKPGVRGTSRIQKTVPYGAELFRP